MSICDSVNALAHDLTINLLIFIRLKHDEKSVDVF